VRDYQEGEFGGEVGGLAAEVGRSHCVMGLGRSGPSSSVWGFCWRFTVRAFYCVGVMRLKFGGARRRESLGGVWCDARWLGGATRGSPI
jgi:hypothetical protein